jgi:hypothetical protein
VDMRAGRAADVGRTGMAGRGDRFMSDKVIRGIACLLALIGIGASPGTAVAQAGSAEELAKKLANPIASLISVPFQFNYNGGIGPKEKGEQAYLNIQPVVPIPLDANWNLISRTILPIVSQHDVFPGAGSQFGTGDITQSFFFSPSQSPGGITWGVGPVLGIPTASDELLGTGKMSVGPTAVALWQGHGWTVGMLANHLWSVAGSPQRAAVSSTFLQPFVAYTTKDAWTFTLNSESTYNWESEQWTVPINGVVSKLVTIGKQPVSLFAGIRYYATSPKDIGPTGWGARAGFTLLFPTGG